MGTLISFPSGVVGPSNIAPFMIGATGRGRSGYGAINVGAGGYQRVGPVRSPIGRVNGYRDQTRPLGPATGIPRGLPVIFPDGKAPWHVGPTVVREGRLRYGSYGSADATTKMPTRLLFGAGGGALFGAVAGILTGSSAFEGAKIGAVSSLLATGLSLLLSGRGSGS
jgi:hypothetical protein